MPGFKDNLSHDTIKFAIGGALFISIVDYLASNFITTPSKSTLDTYLLVLFGAMIGAALGAGKTVTQHGYNSALLFYSRLFKSKDNAQPQEHASVDLTAQMRA